MRLTNISGLPEPLVRAIENDRYSPGSSDITVSQLITPARILALKKAHPELTEDAADRLWALIGQVAHGIIERALPNKRYLTEKRFYINREGYRIGGQIDLFDTETHELSDWKIVSIYQTKDGAKEEWAQQGNILRLLLIENGYAVKSLSFYAIYRDWSKMAAMRKGEDYPQKQVQKFELPVWQLSQTEDFIKNRLSAHQDAARTLPECSPAERWQRPEKFALMRKNRKRAIKLYDNREQAEKMSFETLDTFVESRPAENIRCAYYCPCLPVCDFGKALIATSIPSDRRTVDGE